MTIYEDSLLNDGVGQAWQYKLREKYADLEKDFGESDCISRADVDAVIEQMRVKLKDGRMYILAEVVQDIIRDLPSVTPQEPRKGHWIPSHIPESILDECSECGFSCGAFTFNYCPNCGAKMVEPQESEG